MIADRRLEILRAIVDDYVATNEPVGSKVLAARHSLGISPATIRNEMALLEEDGLISQPHTSAGRIPTDLGYRVFVDRISTVKPLSAPERRAIDHFLEGAVDLDDVVNRTVRLLAQVTKQVAIVQYPSLSKSAVRHIEILPFTPLRLMIVLITDTGRVEQRIVELVNQMNEAQVAQLRSQLNLLCAGEKLNQIPITLKSFTDKFEVVERVNVTSVVNVILEMAIERSEEKVIVSGTANLARIPSDFATSFHPILEALEEQVVLLHLLGETADGTQVKIGHEQDNANLQSTSIVTSGYGPEGERVANLGIIGPTRMDYSGSMSAVSAVARYVSRFLEEGF